jgi:hypothetical protein
METIMPEPVDPATLELLEQRLADRVVERVRPALFKLYAVAGAAVIAVLGFLGFNLLDEASKSLQAKVDKSTEAIAINLGVADSKSSYASPYHPSELFSPCIRPYARVWLQEAFINCSACCTSLEPVARNCWRNFSNSGRHARGDG